jgi:DNA-binding transcriptional LysR family regulator
MVCAAPAYLEGRAVPEHPRELADHDCLVFKPKGPTWQFESTRGPISIDVPQRLIANDNSVLFASACAGNGIAVLPMYVAKDALMTGALLPLLQDFKLQPTWLKALVPRRRQGLARIEAAIGWLRQYLEKRAPWDKS